MRQFNVQIATVVFIAALMVSGCSSSKQSAQATDETSSAVATETQQQEPKHNRIDTLDVQTQNKQQPSYRQETNPPPAPTPTTTSSQSQGTYTVQVGAYKSQDGADRIAQLAKERFGRGVDVSYDAVNNLYKVMVGSFLSKDDARSFRDDMVRKFPADYKDAWVSEHPQK